MGRQRGLTMPELLVVICILGLLTALLLPHLGGLRGYARRLLCANNLRRISEATQTWAADNRSWSLASMATGGWPGLVAAVTHGRECLHCPEGGLLKEGAPVEEQVIIRTSPTSQVGIPLVGLLDGGGYKVLKLSQTQWDSGIAECARYEPVPYVPDANPDVYWWGYDDGAIGSGDYDFQDLAIRVTKHGDGTATLHVVSETAGKPEVWTSDFARKLAGWEQINAYHNHSAAGMDVTLNVGGASHYGMNAADLDLQVPGKVQALDYACAAARSTDLWDRADWDADADGQPDFLRHGGKCNVLLVGGSVRLMSRPEIDPENVAGVARMLWERPR